ncbi:MAG: hypothetical protein JO246_12765 [Frankiaceae bacterium]|nr:hypothetical protein [Frankiaceae bacterium]MBV9872290.1 hypothetical protein [Frankiaceae bacterium]
MITSRGLVAGLLAVGTVLAVGISPAAATGQTPPYQDQQQNGYLGLCDRHGHQITEGSVTTKPFAWRAVSSVAAKPPYDGPGRTAVLMAYQPREGLDAGQWSGQQLTASSRYTDPAHPMAAATAGDDSLADFTANFRPMWDGFIQVRMYLGEPQKPTYSYSYPALNIQITGNTWHAVGGGRVSCTAGRAISIESILLPRSETKARSGTHGTKATSGPAANSKHKTSSHSSRPRPGPSPHTSLTPAASASGSAGHDHGVAIGAVVVAALLGAGVVLALRRRGHSGAA